MSYPRKQYVLARRRAGSVRYFYGEKLGALVMGHVKLGDEFEYAVLTTGPWRIGARKSETTYETEPA